MKFRFLAGTGRTATHWFANLFRDYTTNDACVWHEELPKRFHLHGKIQDTMDIYFTAIEKMAGNRDMFIECNPAFCEWVGYGNKVRADKITDRPFKAAVITRHPFGYIRSMKHHAWGWKWYRLAGCPLGDWGAYTDIEKYARGWRVKNEFALDLVEGGKGICVRMEDVFGEDKDLAIKEIHRLLDWFELKPKVGDGKLLEFSKNKISSNSSGLQRPTNDEKKIIRKICGDLMNHLGYE